MQILGTQEQFDVAQRTVNVQVAGPPTFAGQMRDALQPDRVGPSDSGRGEAQAVGADAVFGSALDDRGVLTGRELKGGVAVTDEVVVP